MQTANIMVFLLLIQLNYDDIDNAVFRISCACYFLLDDCVFCWVFVGEIPDYVLAQKEKFSWLVLSRYPNFLKPLDLKPYFSTDFFDDTPEDEFFVCSLLNLLHKIKGGPKSFSSLFSFSRYLRLLGS